ncbi:MAG: hypothetical protein GF311_01430 [Candidatus Lokiarchaeota archaeon]|nr:hypothetical protein [Candidatus Lokiarchaeota archaeon]
MSFTKKCYEDEGVLEEEASVLYELEMLGKNPLIKMAPQDLEDFLNGTLPFSNLGKLNLKFHEKIGFFNSLCDNLDYFIFQRDYRNILPFIDLKQYELELRYNLNYFRWDDMFFRAIYTTDTNRHLRMICYSIPQNRICEIPDTIVHLKKLEILDLSNNYISQIPLLIKDLSYLKYLSFAENYLDQSFFDQSAVLSQLSNLRYLNLSSNNLTSIPDIFGGLNNLERLDLSLNQLNTLPESIGELRNLKYLNILRNEFLNFPKTIENLISLEELEISYRHLKKIYPNIQNLKSLKIVRVYSVPGEVYKKTLKTQFPKLHENIQIERN